MNTIPKKTKKLPDENVPLLKSLQKDLQQFVNPQKAAFFPRFFKTGKGQYGEGDVFLGITVPDQRKVAKKYFSAISLDDLAKLLANKIHEYRLTALLMLVMKFEKTSKKAHQTPKTVPLETTDQKKILQDDQEHAQSSATTSEHIANFYLKNLTQVNNWDLVDSSAPQILGNYLLNKNRSLLDGLAQTNHLWKQRVAIIATQAFIRKGELEDTFRIAEILLNHQHDLIHKAVGWMLREAGKVNQPAEEKFLKAHYLTMPRTMLRYAIERFDQKKKQAYLKGDPIL
jgi:3-methyladenine DNA glycosylase AlkD